jgi:hypothetical protein
MMTASVHLDLDSAADKDKVRADALVAKSDAEFRGPNIDLHYAVARFFARWLYTRKALWPFYSDWRDRYTDDRAGEKALEPPFARCRRRSTTSG